MLSSKMKMLLFIVGISFVFLFLANLFGLSIPYTMGIAIIIVIGLYFLFDKIKGRLNPTTL